MFERMRSPQLQQVRSQGMSADTAVADLVTARKRYYELLFISEIGAPLAVLTLSLLTIAMVVVTDTGLAAPAEAWDWRDFIILIAIAAMAAAAATMLVTRKRRTPSGHAVTDIADPHLRELFEHVLSGQAEVRRRLAEDIGTTKGGR
jgi:hypothetical protein